MANLISPESYDVRINFSHLSGVQSYPNQCGMGVEPTSVGTLSTRVAVLVGPLARELPNVMEVAKKKGLSLVWKREFAQLLGSLSIIFQASQTKVKCSGDEDLVGTSLASSPQGQWLCGFGCIQSQALVPQIWYHDGA